MSSPESLKIYLLDVGVRRALDIGLAISIGSKPPVSTLHTLLHDSKAHLEEDSCTLYLVDRAVTLSLSVRRCQVGPHLN